MALSGKIFFSLFLAFVGLSNSAAALNVCENIDFGLVADPDRCTGFYVCIFQAAQSVDCPSERPVFDKENSECAEGETDKSIQEIKFSIPKINYSKAILRRVRYSDHLSPQQHRLQRRFHQHSLRRRFHQQLRPQRRFHQQHSPQQHRLQRRFHQHSLQRRFHQHSLQRRFHQHSLRRRFHQHSLRRRFHRLPRNQRRCLQQQSHQETSAITITCDLLLTHIHATDITSVFSVSLSLVNVTPIEFSLRPLEDASSEIVNRALLDNKIL
jgi:Chitin binding Peritrophin-A domain